MNEQAKERDLVCGKHLDDLRQTAEYNKKFYYFCSNTCKKEFEKSPDKYIHKLC